MALGLQLSPTGCQKLPGQVDLRPSLPRHCQNHPGPPFHHLAALQLPPPQPGGPASQAAAGQQQRLPRPLRVALLLTLTADCPVPQAAWQVQHRPPPH